MDRRQLLCDLGPLIGEFEVPKDVPRYPMELVILSGAGITADAILVFVSNDYHEFSKGIVVRLCHTIIRGVFRQRGLATCALVHPGDPPRLKIDVIALPVLISS